MELLNFRPKLTIHVVRTILSPIFIFAADCDFVYISMGEPWVDPSLTYVQLQKNNMLSHLASDVARMRRYVKMKDQSGFVVGIDESERLCVIRKSEPGVGPGAVTDVRISSLSRQLRSASIGGRSKSTDASNTRY